MSSKLTLPLLQFAREAKRQRGVILALALRNFQGRYAGTLGGAIWAVVQPLATIAVYYFVFAIGFRVKSPEDAPYIVWFVGGLVPWLMFADTLMEIANSVTSNAHLVKKTIFPVEVLSFVNVASGIIPHCIFLLILGIVSIVLGVPFRLERFFFIYYFVGMAALLIGIGWLLSALQVLFRDIGQALGIILNVWFWATPIVWPENIIPEHYRWALHYNPMYYVVTGYRDTLIYKDVVWPDPSSSLYFWCVALAALVGGSFVFSRLKGDFADVL